MKIKITPFLFLLFFVLLILKGYFFISTLKLSDDINLLDKKIKKLQEENVFLENQVSSLDSYQIIASLSAQFGFNKKGQILPLDNLGFAYKGN